MKNQNSQQNENLKQDPSVINQSQNQNSNLNQIQNSISMQGQNQKSILSSFLNRDLILILGLFVFSRWIPHWLNFTALGAMSILAPRWLKESKLALALPMLALFITDMVLGFHSLMTYTYGSIFLVSYFSWRTNKNSVNGISEMLKWSLTSSLTFYFITNFGAWLTLDMYSKTSSDLILSYINGFPFLLSDFIGTFIYMGLALLVHRDQKSEVSEVQII